MLSFIGLVDVERGWVITFILFRAVHLPIIISCAGAGIFQVYIIVGIYLKLAPIWVDQMKTFKRILWVLLGIVILIVIGYFIYTAVQL